MTNLLRLFSGQNIRTYLKIDFLFFCVIPGLTRNPATLPFIYKNKDLGIIDLKALTSLDAGWSLPRRRPGPGHD